MAGRHMLETERLLLREFDESDLEAFYILCTDPVVNRYTGDPSSRPTSLEQAREILRSAPLADYAKHGYGRWACVHKASGQVIGFAGLKYLDDLKEVDIGYRFMQAYWGVGLATEASRPIMAYGFDHLKLERIIGMVDPENPASIRVLEKLGLTFTGIMDYRGWRVRMYAAESKRAE